MVQHALLKNYLHAQFYNQLKKIALVLTIHWHLCCELA